MNDVDKHENNRLIDGIVLENSVIFNSTFYRDEFISYLDSCYYQGVLVEHIRMSDLENEQYRKSFYDFMDNKIRVEVDDGGEDDFHPQLFASLLMLRIEQKDSRSFYFLSDVLKKCMTFRYCFYYTQDKLRNLFLSDIAFFITEAYACPDGPFLLDYIHKEIGVYSCFMEEYRFLYEEATLNLKQGQLFLDPLEIKPDIFSKELYNYPVKATFKYPSATRWKIDWEFRNKVWMNDPVDKYFGRTMEHSDWLEFRQSKNERSKAYSLQWEGRVIDFYDVSAYIIDNVLRKFNRDKDYIDMYKNFVCDYDRDNIGLDCYIIHNYYTNGSDGYVNLRNKPSVESDIIASIPNGTYLSYMFGGNDKNSYLVYDHDVGQFIIKDNKWIKVYYPFAIGSYPAEPTTDGIEGYVHSTQLEQR